MFNPCVALARCIRDLNPSPMAAHGSKLLGRATRHEAAPSARTAWHARRRVVGRPAPVGYPDNNGKARHKLVPPYRDGTGRRLPPCIIATRCAIAKPNPPMPPWVRRPVLDDVPRQPLRQALHRLPLALAVTWVSRPTSSPNDSNRAAMAHTRRVANPTRAIIATAFQSATVHPTPWQCSVHPLAPGAAWRASG
jgi:hypothetical protein